jgi:hypothetical protein
MSRLLAVPLLLLINPALAQIPPQHVEIQRLDALPEEQGVQVGMDEPHRHTFFGYKVAMRNGLAFIGMPEALTTGRVGVFTQGANGWTRTATITASDIASGDGFGGAISFRDGLLVVGSSRAVYVYRQVNGVWREQQKIVPPSGDGVNALGDVKHEAGVLAIAAQGNDTTHDSVYIFEQDATGRFVRRARIRGSDATFVRSSFGASIGMTNSIIVVGSLHQAYIFGRNSSGKWVQRQKLVAVDTKPGDGFGLSVAVDRGMILIGAPYADVPGVDPEQANGAVYGFLGGSSGYLESFRLLPRGNLFGHTIAMFGDRIAVAGADMPAGIPDTGFVWTYTREGSSLIPLGLALTGPNTSISIANNLLLVGSPYFYECYTVMMGCTGSAHLFNLNRFVP